MSDELTPHYRITEHLGRYVTVNVDVEPGRALTVTLDATLVHTPAGDAAVRDAVAAWKAGRAAIMEGGAF